MKMDNEWASELAKRNIKFHEFHDKIIFYDPEEKRGTVVIRQHDHNDPRNEMHGYFSYRIGEMSYQEFEKLPKSIRL